MPLNLTSLCDSRLPARFWAKLHVHSNGCWEWLGQCNADGYGRIQVGSTRDGSRTSGYVHRWAYQHLIGMVPHGMELDHLCRVPQCANPHHLEPVTHRENMLRGPNACAVHARKTHCPQGHPYSGTNLKVRRGRRECRACQNAYRREHRRH